MKKIVLTLVAVAALAFVSSCTCCQKGGKACTECEATEECCCGESKCECGGACEGCTGTCEGCEGTCEGCEGTCEGCEGCGETPAETPAE